MRTRLLETSAAPSDARVQRTIAMKKKRNIGSQITISRPKCNEGVGQILLGHDIHQLAGNNDDFDDGLPGGGLDDLGTAAGRLLDVLFGSIF